MFANFPTVPRRALLIATADSIITLRECVGLGKDMVRAIAFLHKHVRL